MHGNHDGSVDRHHNFFGTRLLEKSEERVRYEQSKMQRSPQRLSRNSRAVALRVIKNTCLREKWRLLAAHVRSTHVHVVIAAVQHPEQVVGRLKSCVSRALNVAFGHQKKRWSRHGSTRWLWEPEHIEAAIHYVVGQQGQPMSLYEDPEWEELL